MNEFDSKSLQYPEFSRFVNTSNKLNNDKVTDDACKDGVSISNKKKSFSNASYKCSIYGFNNYQVTQSFQPYSKA